MNDATDLPMHAFPDTAETWLARLLSPECRSADHAAFEDWLAAAPGNALDYAEVERIHRLVASARPEIIAAAVPASRAKPHAQRARRGLTRFAWAASLLLAAGAGFWAWSALQRPTTTQYATQVGEQRAVALADGSGLMLDTDTAVRVSYARTQRHVELLRGRVQANVAHDVGRPFIVASGAGSVRAVGTVFQVERRDDGTVVRLLEGRVVVETRDRSDTALQLQPLQQLSYDREGRIGRVDAIARDEAEGWTQGRLVFRDQRLADLVAEFNRYSRNRLVLADPALEDIRISGVFDARDQAGLIEALRRGWQLQARRGDDGTITLYRAE